MERITLRVEQANRDYGGSGPTGIVVTSAANEAVETYSIPRANKMTELIQEYADLLMSIEGLATKPLSVRMDFSTEDFPRETAERLDIIARCDKYVQALAVKDHMLWEVLQERDELRQSLQEEQELGKEYAEEVSKWAEITQNLSSQLHDLQEQHGLILEKNRSLVNLLREHNIYFVEERL